MLSQATGGLPHLEVNCGLNTRDPDLHPHPCRGEPWVPSPVSIPAVRYNSRRCEAKEARIMPAEASSPPASITGRQPKRVTRMLDKGPVGSAKSPSRLDQSPLQKMCQALYL